MTYLPYLLGIVISYLLGAIPFGYLLVKLIKREDIRKSGSGNIGATNVARVLGKGWALFVLALDAAKGFIPAYVISRFLLPAIFVIPNATGQNMLLLSVICGSCAIIGHLFPVYLRFRGGKGVATGLGVTLAIIPQATALAVVVWIILALLFRYVSLASITAGLALPVGVVLLEFGLLADVSVDRSERITILIFSVVLADLVIIRHIPNIKRLLKGTEPKFPASAAGGGMKQNETTDTYGPACRQAGKH